MNGKEVPLGIKVVVAITFISVGVVYLAVFFGWPIITQSLAYKGPVFTAFFHLSLILNLVLLYAAWNLLKLDPRAYKLFTALMVYAAFVNLFIMGDVRGFIYDIIILVYLYSKRELFIEQRSTTIHSPPE